MTDLVKPFALEQCCYPINNAIHHRSRHAINNHRPGDGKELDRRAGDQTLAFKLQSRGHHGVGKARDGHQGARAGHPGDVIKDTKAGEQCSGYDQEDGHRRAGAFLLDSGGDESVAEQLGKGTDTAPNEEGTGNVFAHGGRFFVLVHQLGILFVGHVLHTFQGYFVPGVGFYPKKHGSLP